MLFCDRIDKRKGIDHSKLILCLNISDIAIITVKFIHYRCIIHFVNNLKQLVY